MNTLLATLREWLEGLGLGPNATLVLERAILLAGILLLAFGFHHVAKRILLRAVKAIARRSQARWDDALVRTRTFDRVAHLAPGVLVHVLAPTLLVEWPGAIAIVRQGMLIYMAAAGLLALNALLDGVLAIYDEYEISRRVHIRSFVQLIKLVLFLLGAVFIISQLVNRSPLVFFSGLGAMTAVLLLIFKDTILGLVAGVQLTANDMVRRGDWITMSRHEADGDVLDVTLTTVKVQNWDKTITTIPTYSLISDAFTNWRGMSESGGRRIKRSIPIDMRSIRICDEEMLERFRKFAYISEYVERKQREVTEWNEAHGLAGDTHLINGRRLTNIGTFRAYAESYLRNHPELHQEMTLLVRQLPATPQGLPIEIYVFSADQRWAEYERILADIFDHLLAVVPEFGLDVFQTPSGTDVSRAGEALARLANTRSDGG